MTSSDNDPKTGQGTTQDPNQADRNAIDPWPAKDDDVPRHRTGQKQTNDDPSSGPGTTSDPNQADRT